MNYTKHTVLSSYQGSQSTDVIWGSAANSSCTRTNDTKYVIEIDDDSSFYLVNITGLVSATGTVAYDNVTVTPTGTTDLDDVNRLSVIRSSGSEYSKLDENTYFGKFSKFEITRTSSLNPVLVHVFQLIL